MEGARATVLAVDDSEDILALVEATLGREHRVKVAADAHTALRLAFEEPRPDLILLDVEMPDASGYEVCKTLKASRAVADVSVIFLSGHADPRDVVKGFQLGAVDYLSKPINPPVLAMRVRTHLELIEVLDRQLREIRKRVVRTEGRITRAIALEEQSDEREDAPRRTIGKGGGVELPPRRPVADTSFLAKRFKIGG